MQFDARAIVLFAGLALWSAPAAAEDRALLIGVNNYRDEAIPDLVGPSKDVLHMQQLLVSDLGFRPNQIMTLTESHATRQGILDAISGWLVSGTNAGDRVVLYFSGHGASVQIPDTNGNSLTSGLVPFDADMKVEGAAETAGGLVLGSQLRQLFLQMDGRLVTVISDSCHSGSLTRGIGGIVDGIKTITPNGPLTLRAEDITPELVAENKANPGSQLFDFNRKGADVIENVAAWSAVTLSQYSYDTADGGVFTNAFVAGLHDRAASPTDGRVTASSQLAYVRSATAAYCGQSKDCSQLGFTPILAATELYRSSVLVPFLPSTNDLEPAEPPADDPAEVATAPEIEPVPEAQPTIEPEPTAEVIEDGPALVDLAQDLFRHDNDFDLAVSIHPGDRVKLGSSVKFRIDSAETGRLLILDTAPDGKLRRIFPNTYSDAANHQGDISGGRTMLIPDETYAMEFIATDAGLGTLIVLVAEPGTDFSEIIDASPAFEEATAPSKSLLAVAAQLQEPLLDPDPSVPNRARRWAFVTVPYFVGE